MDASVKKILKIIFDVAIALLTGTLLTKDYSEYRLYLGLSTFIVMMLRIWLELDQTIESKIRYIERRTELARKKGKLQLQEEIAQKLKEAIKKGDKENIVEYTRLHNEIEKQWGD